MKRGARRLIVKLTLCTLAGAVVTWAVAWGCALWVPRGTALSFWLDVEPSWPLDIGSLRPPDLTFGEGNAFYTHCHWFAEWFDGAQHYATVSFTDLGFPARSMRVADANAESRVVLRTWVEAPRWTYGSDPLNCQLPTRILPLGFTLNTLLAAGVLLGVMEGIPFARRRVRRAKGRCPSCGYDRAGIAMDVACPDCGAV